MNPVNTRLLSTAWTQLGFQRIIWPIFLSIIFLFAIPCPGHPASPDVFYKLNRTAQRDGALYSQPEKDAQVLTSLKKGMNLTLIDEKGEWYIARLGDDQVGWVHQSLLSGKALQTTPSPDEDISHSPGTSDDSSVEPIDETDSPRTMLTVKVPSARVRKSPDLESSVIFGLKKGDTVASLDFQAPWHQIRGDDGETGWAHQSLFESRPVTPSPEPDSTPSEDEPKEMDIVDDRTVRAIQVDLSPEGAEKAIFELSGFHPPKTFVLEDEVPKIVCDFYDLSPGKDMRRRINVGGNLIKQIRTGVHSGERAKLRVVVDLVSNRDYEVEQVFYKQQNLYILTVKPTTIKDTDTL